MVFIKIVLYIAGLKYVHDILLYRSFPYISGQAVKTVVEEAQT